MYIHIYIFGLTIVDSLVVVVVRRSLVSVFTADLGSGTAQILPGYWAKPHYSIPGYLGNLYGGEQYLITTQVSKSTLNDGIHPTGMCRYQHVPSTFFAGV